MSMAAAYATVASGGIYCEPVAITKVTDADGESLPVPSANCHRVMSSDVAAAVDYILQGVLTDGRHRVRPRGIPGYQAAGKTGTSNVRRERHALRGVRRLHHQPGQLHLGVQPDLADRAHDDRHCACYPPSPSSAA